MMAEARRWIGLKCFDFLGFIMGDFNIVAGGISF